MLMMLYAHVRITTLYYHNMYLSCTSVLQRYVVNITKDKHCVFKTVMIIYLPLLLKLCVPFHRVLYKEVHYTQKKNLM